MPVFLGAVSYGIAGLNLQVGFKTDPVGARTLPLIVAAAALICGLVMVVRPDPDLNCPTAGVRVASAVAVVTPVGYSLALKPMGFPIPTAITAVIRSYLIEPRWRFSVLAGLGLAGGLFITFRYGIRLNLVGYPGVF